MEKKLLNTKKQKHLLKNASIINMVGKKTVSLSLELGVGSENAIKIVGGVPFLIVFKM